MFTRTKFVTMFGRRHVSAGPSFDAAATAWFAAVNTAAGGTDAALDTQTKNAVNAFFVEIRAAGLIDAFDFGHIPFARSIYQADVDLFSLTSWAAGKTNSPTWTDKWGYSSNGTTSYIKTGFNPSTATKFSQNSQSVVFSAIDTYPVQGDIVAICGGWNGTRGVQVLPKGDFTILGGASGNLGAGLGYPAPTQSGTFVYSRTGSAVSRKFVGGVKIGTDDTTASDVSANVEVYALARNNTGGSTVDLFNQGKLGALFFGRGLTNAEALAMTRAVDHLAIALRLSATAKATIYDADMCSDVGDLGAFINWVALAKRGVHNPKLCLCNSSEGYGASIMRSLLDANGFENVVVSAYQGSDTDNSSAWTQRQAAFYGVTNDRTYFGGVNGGTAPVTAARTALAANSGAVWCSVGFSKNIYNTLISAADGVSPLTGAQLMATLSYYSIQIGDAPSSNVVPDDFNYTEISAEWDYFINNTSSVKRVFHGASEYSAPTDVKWGPGLAIDTNAPSGRAPWDQATASTAAMGVVSPLQYGGQNGLMTSSGGVLNWSASGGIDDYVTKAVADASVKSAFETIAVEVVC